MAHEMDGGICMLFTMRSRLMVYDKTMVWLTRHDCTRWRLAAGLPRCIPLTVFFPPNTPNG